MGQKSVGRRRHRRQPRAVGKLRQSRSRFVSIGSLVSPKMVFGSQAHGTIVPREPFQKHYSAQVARRFYAGQRISAPLYSTVALDQRHSGGKYRTRGETSSSIGLADLLTLAPSANRPGREILRSQWAGPDDGVSVHRRHRKRIGAHPSVTTPFTYSGSRWSPANAAGTASSDVYRCVINDATSITPRSIRSNAAT